MSGSPSFASPTATPHASGRGKEEERCTKTIYDGSILIEGALKRVESDWERKPAIGRICIYPMQSHSWNKAVHWAKYFFAKFYRHNELEKYSYAYIALACVYLVLKIQDSEKTHIISISEFLELTRKVWQPYVKERKLKVVAYILPRVECIVFQGIDFDLCVDIPHNYVPKLLRVAFNMKVDGVDGLYVPNAEHPDPRKPSELIKHFLRYCMGSFLCVDYPPRVVAAAAVLYALRVTGLMKKPQYHASWVQEFSEKEIDEIIARRKFVADATRRDPSDHTRSPTMACEEDVPSRAVSEKRQHAEEKVEKRPRVGDESLPAPILPSEGVSVVQPTIPAPLIPTTPAPLIPTIPAPLIPSNSPAPLISTNALAPLIPSNSPAPLIPTNSPAPLIPTNSPAPLIPSNSPAPLIPSNSPAPLIPSNSPAPLIPSNSPAPLIPSNSPAPLIPSTSSCTETPLFPNNLSQQSSTATPGFTVDFGLQNETKNLFSFSPNIGGGLERSCSDAPTLSLYSYGSHYGERDIRIPAS